jgi:hypothetical protein
MRGLGRRRLAYIVSGFALTLIGLFGADRASADLRIKRDPGGLIAGHMQAFAEVRDTGQAVVIDGPCYSACTLVLGMVPHEKICVTRRARLGFHAAWAYAPDGSQIMSESGTAHLWKVYPQHVRSWITRKGGLSRKMIFLSGGELTSMYRSCR